MINNTLDETALDILFRTARSHSYWRDQPVSDAQLQQIYELMKFGPTTANSCPARIVFVKSVAAKERLKPCLSEGNVRKSMEAPVVAIVGGGLPEIHAYRFPKPGFSPGFFTLR